METNIIEGILDCQICLSLICEPIMIDCGHSFCRICLAQSLNGDKKQCVICRAICTVDAATARENVMLKQIAYAINPSLYESRLSEADVIKSQWSSIMPLFHHPTELQAGWKITLHLFETKYKAQVHVLMALPKHQRDFVYVSAESLLISIEDSQSQELVGVKASLSRVQFYADMIRCEVEALPQAPRYRIKAIYGNDPVESVSLGHDNYVISEDGNSVNDGSGSAVLKARVAPIIDVPNSEQEDQQENEEECKQEHRLEATGHGVCVDADEEREGERADNNKS